MSIFKGKTAKEKRREKERTAELQASLGMLIVSVLAAIIFFDIPGMILVGVARDHLDIEMNKWEAWALSISFSAAIVFCIWILIKDSDLTYKIYLYVCMGVTSIAAIFLFALNADFPGRYASIYFGSELISLPKISVSPEYESYILVEKCDVIDDMTIRCKFKNTAGDEIPMEFFRLEPTYKTGYDSHAGVAFPDPSTPSVLPGKEFIQDLIVYELDTVDTIKIVKNEDQ